MQQVRQPEPLRDQGVGGSNPLSPTILSGSSMIYAACAASTFSAVFGTFGTTRGNSNPNPHRSAHFLRNATSSLISKRQARRTVDLYNKYRSKVHFVVIDLDVQRSPEQQKLVKQYYEGYIPHVLVLDAHGEALYNHSGEVDSEHIEDIFRNSLGH